VTGSTTATFYFVSSSAGSTFQCSLDGGAWTTCTSPQTYSGLASGAHTFSVKATDPAGNVDATPATSSWTVDTSAPVVTLSSPAPGSYTNDSTPSVSGTAETAPGNSAVTVDIYSGAGTSGTPVEVLSAPVGSGGSWTIDATTLAEGAYTVQAHQSNAVSTTGYSQQRTFTVDTTAPTVTLYAPANGTQTNDVTPSVSAPAGRRRPTPRPSR
jgi:hypothetical protein